jgi:DNA-binding NtrC family response regulator
MGVEEPQGDGGGALLRALLLPHEPALRRLGRRLSLLRDSAFLHSWLEQCARSATLVKEHADYPLPIQRGSAPLLDSLASGRLELAELHAGELFADLRDLPLSIGSVLNVIVAFEEALRLNTEHADFSAAIEVLGRFMTCTAVGLFGKRPTPALTESSERVRPLVNAKPALARRLIGDSPQMRELRAELSDVARAPGSVLIVGESGTGKELVAEALHELGNFSVEPFLAVNCAALPPELIESELFGYERGAFTGSRGSAPGLLRAAGRGTLFLDEITEMPAPLQPKLLRALEQRAVRPLGGLREVPVHARIVAATNADPELDPERRGLRLDLFYRLCVHRISVPPLRERLTDIPLLVEHFLRELARAGHRVPSAFSAASLAMLEGHSWPGNVRELRNVVEHSSARAKLGLVEPHHLPRSLSGQPARAKASSGSYAAFSEAPLGEAELLPLKLVERRHIEHALAVTRGNKALAARLLGVSRHQLYLKLERMESDEEA